jgi:choice-of-anchor C domain-containing protein
MKILGLLAGAALLLGAQTAHAATVNLVSNGSFESGPAVSNFTTLNAGNGTLTDWDIIGGSVDYIGSYWPAADGTKSLDLSGNAPGTITQQIAGLVDGQEYRVSFSLRGNGDATSSAAQGLTVSINGADLTFSAPKTATSWAVQTFTFVYDASGLGNDLLVFAAGANGAYGPGLDNISVTATPIPGAVLLFGSALAGMGFLGYRRHKAQAAA